MSIWTCDPGPVTILRTAAQGAAVLVLSGCLAVPGGGKGSGSSPQNAPPEQVTRRAAPQSLKVFDGDVTIVAPDGYCIDKAATRSNDTGAFVLLGSCRAISRDPKARHPTRPMVFTASVAPATPESGAQDEAALDRLEHFFATDQGRRALSRSRDGETLEVQDMIRSDGVLFVQVKDSAKNRPAALRDSYWRGLFDLNGHLVTVTAMTFDGDGESDDRAGLSALQALVAQLRAANRGAGLRKFVNRLL